MEPETSVARAAGAMGTGGYTREPAEAPWHDFIAGGLSAKRRGRARRRGEGRDAADQSLGQPREPAFMRDSCDREAKWTPSPGLGAKA